MVLDEADRFFVCEFCRVRSCIHQKNYFRYQFTPSEKVPQNEEIFYLPYWRFKGVSFSCSTDGQVNHRFIDLSQLALTENNRRLPVSLGVRSQALKLKLVSEESQGTFLQPLGLKNTMTNFDNFCSLQRSGEDTLFQEYIGETVSLIYSPVYIYGNDIIDGILKKPLSTCRADEVDLRGLETCRPEQETLFIPGICPSCGWDLEGSSDSLALVCHNCNTLWRPHGNKLAKIRFRRGLSQNREAAYLPFWRIAADVSGLELQSYADLITIANLPKVIQPQWHDLPFYFWAPAFKIRPKIFMRLTRQLAITQPQLELAESLDKATLYPVTLPPGEAVESMKLTLAAAMSNTRKNLTRLPEVEITPRKIKLIYLPFDQRHHDLYHPELRVSINKNILALAKNL